MSWADVSKMTKVSDDAAVREKGDINGDGSADKYDLAALSAFLRRKKELPEGISVLTSAERTAADMNSDGTVDDADLIALLAAIQY